MHVVTATKGALSVVVICKFQNKKYMTTNNGKQRKQLGIIAKELDQGKPDSLVV